MNVFISPLKEIKQLVEHNAADKFSVLLSEDGIELLVRLFLTNLSLLFMELSVVSLSNEGSAADEAGEVAQKLLNVKYFVDRHYAHVLWLWRGLCNLGVLGNFYVYSLTCEPVLLEASKITTCSIKLKYFYGPQYNISPRGEREAKHSPLAGTTISKTRATRAAILDKRHNDFVVMINDQDCTGYVLKPFVIKEGETDIVKDLSPDILMLKYALRDSCFGDQNKLPHFTSFEGKDFFLGMQDSDTYALRKYMAKNFDSKTNVFRSTIETQIEMLNYLMHTNKKADALSDYNALVKRVPLQFWATQPHLVECPQLKDIYATFKIISKLSKLTEILSNIDNVLNLSAP